MPMGRALIKTVGNLAPHSSKAKTKERRMLGMTVSTLFKSSDTDESLDDEDSKMESYITRQFKKFMKNANGKGFDKDRRQSNSS